MKTTTILAASRVSSHTKTDQSSGESSLERSIGRMQKMSSVLLSKEPSVYSSRSKSQNKNHQAQEKAKK